MSALRFSGQMGLTKVSDLELDPKNPRLGDSHGTKQFDILRYLVQHEALEELVVSFARHGYFSEEPLVIVPSDKGGKWTVVEGNRRLAALKIILEPESHREAPRLSVLQLSAEQRQALTPVPTVSYEDRRQVEAYLGVRHITGVRRWDPYPRAKYVAELVTSLGSIEDAQEMVGDIGDTVRKLYQSYVVYEQAVELGVPRRDIVANFSLLEVLLSQGSVKQFIGLPRSLPRQPVKALVPEDCLEHLKDLIGWVFGNQAERLRPVITDSRQIRGYLGAILQSPEAVECLRETRDLMKAYDLSGGERMFLLQRLRRALQSMQEANAVYVFHKDDPEVVDAYRRLQEYWNSAFK